jgi:hypothetical protein
LLDAQGEAGTAVETGILNRVPHGPELWAVSSTETVFEDFEINSDA